MEAVIGTIVRSAAGRDKGNFLVITAVEGDFVFVADGKERKLGKPKKKRLKHLKLTNTVIDTGNLTDKELRKIVSEFTKP